MLSLFCKEGDEVQQLSVYRKTNSSVHWQFFGVLNILFLANLLFIQTLSFLFSAFFVKNIFVFSWLVAWFSACWLSCSLIVFLPPRHRTGTNERQIGAETISIIINIVITISIIINIMMTISININLIITIRIIINIMTTISIIINIMITTSIIFSTRDTIIYWLSALWSSSALWMPGSIRSSKRSKLNFDENSERK